MNDLSPKLIDMEVLERVAPVIRVAAHPLRLRILDYLAVSNEPKIVSDITECCGAAPSFVSQQLRILKDQGILRCQRRGTNVYYTIADRSLLHLLACIRHSQGGEQAVGATIHRGEE
ncbi:MAG: helix-turn-helix transcriptional regulator [Chthonomonadales bacterium]|nr:helix-turn-helix transcriptional regulator [Chthonomonadales bacterium]